MRMFLTIALLVASARVARSQGAMESFEAVNLSTVSVGLGTSVPWDSRTVFNAGNTNPATQAGPGLIVPGVELRNLYGGYLGLGWYKANFTWPGWVSPPSQTFKPYVGQSSPNGILTGFILTFDAPVRSFGFVGYGYNGQSNCATVEMYGTNNQLLATDPVCFTSGEVYSHRGALEVARVWVRNAPNRASFIDELWFSASGDQPGCWVLDQNEIGLTTTSCDVGSLNSLLISPIVDNEGHILDLHCIDDAPNVPAFVLSVDGIPVGWCPFEGGINRFDIVICGFPGGGFQEIRATRWISEDAGQVDDNGDGLSEAFVFDWQVGGSVQVSHYVDGLFAGIGTSPGPPGPGAGVPPLFPGIPGDPATLSTAQACDLDSSGACDSADEAILVGALGACVGSSNYLPLADVDADGCVTSADQELMFGPAAQSLQGDASTVSATTGGTQHLYLNAGHQFAGHAYRIVGSLSGTTPGFVFGGLQLPLNMDAYMAATLSGGTEGLLVDGVGVLDALGRGSGRVVVPPGAIGLPSGTTLTHAFIVCERSGSPGSGGTQPAYVATTSFVSNPLELTIVP